MRSKPHPFAQLPPNKMVLPQGVLPPPPANNSPTNAAAAQPAARLPLGACFNCGQTGPSSARGSNLHEDSGPRTRETCLASCTYTGR